LDHGRPPDGLRGADAGGQALALHRLPLPPGVQRILGDRRINPAKRGKRREASRGWKGMRRGQEASNLAPVYGRRGEGKGKKAWRRRGKGQNLERVLWGLVARVSPIRKLHWKRGLLRMAGVEL
jgi:hypothetical protein